MSNAPFNQNSPLFHLTRKTFILLLPIDSMYNKRTVKDGTRGHGVVGLGRRGKVKIYILKSLKLLLSAIPRIWYTAVPSLFYCLTWWEMLHCFSEHKRQIAQLCQHIPCIDSSRCWYVNYVQYAFPPSLIITADLQTSLQG